MSSRILAQSSGIRGPAGPQGPAGSGGGSTNVAGATHAATNKSTPVSADEFPLADSAASYVLKKTTWGNILTTILAALSKSSVGLANVDNTSDTNKPVSTAQQTALDLKLPTSGVQAAVEGALPGAALMVYYNTGSSSWPTLATSLSTDSAISWHFVGGDVSHAPPTVSGNAVWDRPT